MSELGARHLREARLELNWIVEYLPRYLYR